MKNQKEILEGLKQFYGTTQYFRVSPRLVLTDGMKYLCDSCECYWLADIVSSILFDNKILTYFKRQSPVVVSIKKNDKGGFLVSVGNNEKKPIYTQEIESSDFPLDSFWFYVGDNGNFWVAMVPSEN